MQILRNKKTFVFIFINYITRQVKDLDVYLGPLIDDAQ